MWCEAVIDDKDRVERIPYELCVLKALREAIRRRERTGGATLTTICPPISRTTATCTTPPCVPRGMAASSSPI